LGRFLAQIIECGKRRQSVAVCVPTLRVGTRLICTDALLRHTRRSSVANAFPRRSVGTRLFPLSLIQVRGASHFCTLFTQFGKHRIEIKCILSSHCSHDAGASQIVPTLRRGNEIISIIANPSARCIALMHSLFTQSGKHRIEIKARL
jgi:hypothetical protein